MLARGFGQFGILTRAILTMAVAGCGSQQQVTRYEVVKSDGSGTEPQAGAVPADPQRNITPPANASRTGDRMLAALLTRGDRTWSFKMSGPADRLAQYATSFRDLLKSVREADGEIAWDTPAGWQQRPASGMRWATLIPDTAAPPLECSVIVLPRQDELANVNRWRGQLQLPPISADELASQTESIRSAVGDILLLDITGTLAADSRMPPFMAQRGRTSVSSAAPPASDSPFRFSAPEHWEPAPKRWSQLEVFSVEDGSQRAEASVAVLGRAGGALERNVNRWRGQLGLAPWSESEMVQLLKTQSIGGIEANMVELSGEDGSRAIVGAILYRGDSAWFFKLSGDKPLVDREREAFQEFLDSIEFPTSSD